MQQAALGGGDQGKGASGHAGASGASDAVDVVGRDERQVEVDDERQMHDVEPARGNVGRDQHGHASRLEVAERTIARALALVAVNDRRLHASPFKALADAVRPAFRLAEDQRLTDGRLGQDVRQQVGLAAVSDRMDAVRHRRRHDMTIADVDAHGLAREGAREPYRPPP